MQPNAIEHQVHDLHNKEYSIRAIASHLGIDKSRVQRILKKLQESGETEDVKVFDTPDDTAFGIHDTVYDIRSDTSSDTGDTHLNWGKEAENEAQINMAQAVLARKSFTLTETRHLMEQMGRYMLEYFCFVYDICDTHDTGIRYAAADYKKYSTKAKKLIKSAKVLAEQVEVNHEDLLVTLVLQSINVTVLQNLTMDNVFEDKDGTPIVELDPLDTEFWQNQLSPDFLSPTV